MATVTVRRLLILLVWLGGTSLWIAAAPAHYRIEARLDLKKHLISGTEELTLTNSGREELREVYLFLYPNRFLEKNPGLTEMNYRWHYPSGRDRGWLKTTGIHDAASGVELQSESIEGQELPQGTLLRVVLPEPLAPGAETVLRIGFETRIPYKYGPFGRYRDMVTLQGGWYPYLVPTSRVGQPEVRAFPEKSSFQLDLTLSATRDAVLNGTFFDDVSEISLDREARTLSLVVAPRLLKHSVPAGSRTVTFYTPFKDRYKLEKVLQAFADPTAVAAEFLPGARTDEVVLVETYLRAVMTIPGDSMILVSDRFMVTVEKFDFRNLNRLEAARAVAQLMAAPLVGQRENPVDLTWVTEAVAWVFRNHFLDEKFKDLSNLRETAGSMSMFRPFNRMAASPTIPFSETYVGNVVNREPLRYSLGYFNNGFPSGRLFAEKLRDTLSDEAFRKVFDKYLSQDLDFQSLVHEVSGQDMAWFFEQWKQGYPDDLDYRLAVIGLNEKTDSGYRTRFTVEKSSSRPLIEPLEVRVNELGQDPSTVVWDGRGSVKEFEVVTSNPVTNIQIDPRARTVQSTDANDVSPRSWEMVMDRGDVDIGSGGLGAGMRIRMHKVNDRSKWMFVLPFFSTAEYGFETGMLFDFGSNVEGLVWNKQQEMSISYSLTGLRGDFADLESGRVDGNGRDAALKLRYTFQNKMFEEDPMSFNRLEVSAEIHREELGGNFNFFKTKVTGAKVVSLHPKHKLAGIVALGYSDGFRSTDEIPAQKLFDLSSVPFIGFAGSGRFLAENTLASSLEWRHDLMSDMNMSMPMNNRIRRLQGVLSFDVGWVSPRFGEMFRLNEAIYGVKYGLRFHYSFLGIRPSNFTVDFGYRLGDGNRDGGSKFQWGMGILQTF